MPQVIDRLPEGEIAKPLLQAAVQVEPCAERPALGHEPLLIGAVKVGTPHLGKQVPTAKAGTAFTHVSVMHRTEKDPESGVKSEEQARVQTVPFAIGAVGQEEITLLPDSGGEELHGVGLQTAVGVDHEPLVHVKDNDPEARELPLGHARLQVVPDAELATQLPGRVFVPDGGAAEHGAARHVPDGTFQSPVA